MAGLRKTSTGTQRLNQAMIQSSTFGIPITLGWGTFRCSLNLVYLGPLQSRTDKSSSGGKGGNGGTKTYDYSANVILAACEGGASGIVGCKEMFKDSSHFVDGDLHTRYSAIATALSAAGNVAMAADYSTLATLAQAINTGATTAMQSAGLSLAPGALGQPSQGWLSGDDAIGYSETAYFWAQNYSLSTSATLPNHTATLSSTTRAVVAGVTLDDAEPSAVIADALGNVHYGLPGWPSGVLGDLSEYATANVAYGFFISPVWDSQTSAASAIQEVLDATNAAAFWSEGVLKVRPYADTGRSANGVVFTPDLTPVYSLGDDDYVLNGDDDPVTCAIKAPSDAYNIVQVEFDDRTHQYNSQTVPAQDQAAIDQFGPRKEDPVSYRCIKMPSVATAIAQVRVQRSANLWQTFSFKLGPEFALLEPMDLLEISDAVLGLNAKLVRITAIEEGDDDLLTITAEEMLVGASHPPLITRQGPTAVITNYDVAPGNVNGPVLINPPRTLTGGGNELWIAVSGGANYGGCEVWISLDGTGYSKAGEINGRSSYGTLTAALAAGSDPDTANALHLDLSPSGGSLASTTTATADAGGTLCLVGPEVISFAGATLTGFDTYTLNYLRRGLYATANAAHALGVDFVRLDGAIFKYPYDAMQAGKTISVKFLAFNLFGRAPQALSDVGAYALTLDPGAPPELDIVANRIVGQGTGATTDVGSLATQNTVGNSDIDNSSVTTDKIGSNAVTQSVADTSTSALTCNSTDLQVLSDTITLTADAVVEVQAIMKLDFTSGTTPWNCKLFINGSQIMQTYGTNFQDACMVGGSLTVAGGTPSVPINVPISVTVNANSSVVVRDRNLFGNAFKR